MFRRAKDEITGARVLESILGAGAANLIAQFITHGEHDERIAVSYAKILNLTNKPRMPLRRKLDKEFKLILLNPVKLKSHFDLSNLAASLNLNGKGAITTNR